MNATADSRVCVYQGCSEPRSKKAGRGLCAYHYHHVRAAGRLDEFPGQQVFASIEERFFAKVEVTGFCWLWTAASNNRGYGVFGLSRRESNVYAHRWAYENLVGPIPEGLTLDHLCRVPLCVNPDHLEPVTLEENIARKPAVTVCIRGHDLSDAYVRKNGDRMCRACRSERKGRVMRCCAKCSTPGYGCANGLCDCHAGARSPEREIAEMNGGKDRG